MSKLISAVLILIIVAGAGHAYEREPVRHMNLQAEFNRTNVECFHGQLSATVLWASLPSDYGQTFRDEKLILIDRNNSAWQVRETIRHEACHLFVDDDMDNRNHGPLFQECMQRFR